MKTIVTGGAGFIGSHLSQRLLDDGHQVTVIDNFSNGRLENLAPMTSNARFTLHQTSLGDGGDLSSVFAGVDWVFHLAGLADIVPSINDPTKYHRANVDGTVQVLEAARNSNVKRFVYAASSSCYGLPQQVPTPETAPVQPMYPYALTKYIGEQYVMHWHKVYGLPCVSLRLFNVFGPRSRTTGAYGAVFGVFLAQKLDGKPFTVVGDGHQTRDFTFVTDVLDAFVKTAESTAEGEVLNVGSGGTYSINSLVSLLGGASVHLPKRPGEPDCTFADIGKIQSITGWQPRVSFEAGVSIMMENIEQWRDAPVWEPEAISVATRDWFKYLSNPSSADLAVGHDRRAQ